MPWPLIQRALLVVLIPLLNLMPQFLSWRMRSRIDRWYGELALLEREVNAAGGASRKDKWLSDLDRIEHGVGGLRIPPKFASEAYTLREHIGLVRRAVMDKVEWAAHRPT